LSWHGLAGPGIGGMSGVGPNVVNVSSGYVQTLRTDLHSVPVLAAGTKSFSARWVDSVSRSIDAQLRDDESMLAGRFTNDTAATLQNARLLYGTWAYRLKDIEPGGSRELNHELVPISVQTLVTGLALGVAPGTAAGAERAQLPTDRASAEQLLNAMMFFDAAGGASFAGLPLRYQSYCDLSRQLELGRAVLVADVDGPGSQLVDAESDRPLGGTSDGTSKIIYRFVLPVEKTK
jgi:hypothetical protein